MHAADSLMVFLFDSKMNSAHLVSSGGFNVASSIAEVATDSQSWWPLAAVPPRVEGGDGNPEAAGEVLGPEQFIESFHVHIVARVDVNWVTSSCQGCCQRVCGGFVTDAAGSLLSI
jgi:hypothetical protein